MFVYELCLVGLQHDRGVVVSWRGGAGRASAECRVLSARLRERLHRAAHLGPYEAIGCICEENGGVVLRSNFYRYYERFCLCYEQFDGSAGKGRAGRAGQGSAGCESCRLNALTTGTRCLLRRWALGAGPWALLRLGERV